MSYLRVLKQASYKEMFVSICDTYIIDYEKLAVWRKLAKIGKSDNKIN